MLRILLRNLLDNAIRYTPPGGKVGVSVTVHADAVTLMVSDSGPGSPAEQRAQVLQRLGSYPAVGVLIGGAGKGEIPLPFR